MIAFFASIFGPRYARAAMLATAAIAVLLMVWGAIEFQAWRKRDAVADQAEQGTRSSEALAGAASNAIETVINAEGRDASIDTIVTEATKEIDNAQSPAAARAAVLDGVCSLPEYANDPACAVR